MTAVEFDDVGFGYGERAVVSGLSLSLERGVYALTGPNGAGKSTFLLLAAGRLLPQKGTVRLEGQPTAGLAEDERQRLCSVVYQNMEFETEEPLGKLLEVVFRSGFLPESDQPWIAELTRTLELDTLLGRPTADLSKGQMQRAVLAFALLYGSRVLVLDEPVFALEEGQKRRTLELVRRRALATGGTVLYSAHELELTRDHSDQVLLFDKTGRVQLGPPDEMLTRERLEAAYEVPYALLHQKEQLYRSML